MVKGLYRVQRIHHTVLRGKPLLLLPERVLVRWPERVPMPALGDWFTGTAVTVPPHLHETVMTLLFGSVALLRCEAAKRLAQNKYHRKHILSRIYSRSYVQKALATTERIEPEIREQIEALGDVVSLRRVFKVACSPTTRGAAGTSECTGEKGP